MNIEPSKTMRFVPYLVNANEDVSMRNGIAQSSFFDSTFVCLPVKLTSGFAVIKLAVEPLK